MHGKGVVCLEDVHAENEVLFRAQGMHRAEMLDRIR